MLFLQCRWYPHLKMKKIARSGGKLLIKINNCLKRSIQGPIMRNCHQPRIMIIWILYNLGNGRPNDGKQSHVAKGREAVSREVSSPYLIIKWLASAKEPLKIFPIFVFWKRQLYTEFGLPWWLSSEESPCNAGDMDEDRGAWWVTVYGVTREGRNLATKPPPPPNKKERKLLLYQEYNFLTTE